MRPFVTVSGCLGTVGPERSDRRFILNHFIKEVVIHVC